ALSVVTRLEVQAGAVSRCALIMIRYQIITTEKVPFSYRVAGIGSRFLAWLIDSGLMLVLGIMGLMFATIVEAFQPGVGAAVAGLWVFVLSWGYFLFFEWLWLGQTPGKRVVGIRVIQQHGTSIGFLESAVRNVVRLVDWLPPPVYGFGVLVAVC